MPFPYQALQRLTLLSALALPVALPAASQPAPPAPASAEKVYTYVEQMPELPGGGGNAAIVTLIQQRVAYPPRAMRAHAEGRVFVSFTVATTGLVGDVAVVKGIRSDCDSAVVQAVKQLPRFEPGRQVGRPVPVRFTVPVTFRLQAPPAAARAAAGLPDSSRVYTYVEHMPVYPGGGLPALSADLLREFRVASAAGGCTEPTFPVYVSLTVGPSGGIYDVRSINNLPLISKEQAAAGAKGMVATQRTLPELPASCEAAVAAAARKLPRLKPGTQNGRRVAVNFTVKLIGPAK